MRIIYQDKDLLVVDKPAGMDVAEMMDVLIKDYPDLKKAGEEPRYGLIHRLDKDTSGIILLAKSNEALIFFQKQFINKEIEKRYIALAVGNIEDNEGKIETLIGRSKKDGKKQKVYFINDPGSLKGKRKAITDYKVKKRFNNYTLLEVFPQTGRKHQIRVHLAYLNHPLAGDKIYGFKNQICPKNLKRHFLHAEGLKIKMKDNRDKEFYSLLPDDLEEVIKNL